MAAVFLGSASGGLWRAKREFDNVASINWDQVLPTDTSLWENLTDRIGQIGLNLLDDYPSDGVGTGINNIGAIAADPFFGNRIYVGTGEANNTLGELRPGSGILWSDDGGDTWHDVTGAGPLGNSLAFFGHSVSKIIVDPTTPVLPQRIPGNVLFASVVPSGLPWTGVVPTPQDTIYESLDAGRHWSKVFPPAGNNNNYVISDMEYTVINNQLTLFAATGKADGSDLNGIWAGAVDPWTHSVAWAEIHDALGVNSATVGRIALASDHASTIYAAVAQPARLSGSKPKLLEIRKSTNVGYTWTDTGVTAGTVDSNDEPYKTAHFEQAYYNLAFAVSQTGAVYLGGDTPVLKSTESKKRGQRELFEGRGGRGDGGGRGNGRRSREREEVEGTLEEVEV
jgi:hypothetical protein